MKTTTTHDRVPPAAQFRRRRHLATGREVLADVVRLVERAQRGDGDAFEQLYTTYADNVYGYVCSIVRDEHEAEDVTQQVFAKVITAVSRYRRQDVPFAAWLLRIAHNTAIDHVRARQRAASDCLEAVAGRSDARLVEEGTSLRVALRTLPEDQRRVVVLRHIVGLTPPEIAERLGRSENAVHGLHHRGRRALRQHLRTMGSAPSTMAA